MKAPKNIKLNLPEDIIKFRERMMLFDGAESRCAYLRLIKKEVDEYYRKNINEYEWLEKDILKMIDKKINEIKPDIEAEREDNKPIGWKYDEDVMELELDLYDTIEEQIEYLKNKLIEFDIDTINITTNIYDDLRRDLEIRIKNRQYLLNQNKNERPLFGFDFTKIKKYVGELQEGERILFLKYILKEFDREKRENYYLFMELNEIEYFKENLIITDTAKLNEPLDFTLMGIGSKQKLAIENFEINILNEIDFLTEKNKVLQKNNNVEIIDGPMDYEGMLDTYFEYGKECYLSTWKDEYQFLTFEKKMTDRYGDKIKQHTYQLYNFISKKTNPIEFIRCNVAQFIYQPNNEKLKNEIIRINNYIKELEKLEYNTSDEKNMNNIPEDELEKYEEWQCYFIKKIKYEELVEWIDILRKNRPGVTDYKYGEFYQLDFKNVTNFGLTELRNYRDRIESMLHLFETNTNDNNKLSEQLLKPFGRGELQEALEPIAKEFNLVIGESAKSTKVRSITKGLIKQGWDANEASVSEALRKMGFVKGRRK